MTLLLVAVVASLDDVLLLDADDDEDEVPLGGGPGGGPPAPCGPSLDGASAKALFSAASSWLTVVVVEAEDDALVDEVASLELDDSSADSRLVMAVCKGSDASVEDEALVDEDDVLADEDALLAEALGGGPGGGPAGAAPISELLSVSELSNDEPLAICDSMDIRLAAACDEPLASMADEDEDVLVLADVDVVLELSLDVPDTDDELT